MKNPSTTHINHPGWLPNVLNLYNVSEHVILILGDKQKAATLTPTHSQSDWLFTNLFINKTNLPNSVCIIFTKNEASRNQIISLSNSIGF